MPSPQRAQNAEPSSRVSRSHATRATAKTRLKSRSLTETPLSSEIGPRWVTREPSERGSLVETGRVLVLVRRAS